jgi:glutamyl-tRNA(Gln) amidotransferase subunit E
LENLDYAKLGFKCCLEIHQQLATRKLFCSCSTQDLPREPGEPDFRFIRKLRPTLSELGEVDAAALKEARRSRRFEYRGYAGHACLVDADEEPPHPASADATDVALTMSILLGAHPVQEIQWMRKIVIDGSNTSGFQRTGLVSLGGHVEDVAIQTLALEEDSCQRLGEEGDRVIFGLDRLGIPLIEIATAPTIRDGQHARQIAARLGALLRATGRVKRGIGTIRQDLNVSIRGGARIEIKGAQELNAIPRIIDAEVRRQLRLLEVKDLLAKRGVTRETLQTPIVDVGPHLASSSSAIVKKNRDKGGVLHAVRLVGFHQLIGSKEKGGPGSDANSQSTRNATQALAGSCTGTSCPHTASPRPTFRRCGLRSGAARKIPSSW